MTDTEVIGKAFLEGLDVGALEHLSADQNTQNS
jgi:hypothetical protein